MEKHKEQPICSSCIAQQDLVKLKNAKTELKMMGMTFKRHVRTS